MTVIGDVLQSARVATPIDPFEHYVNIGVRSFGNGVIRYPPCPGSELSKLRFYRFVVPSLIVSNIKAWEGAVAMTSEFEVDCIASNRFLIYVPRPDAAVDLRYIFHFLLSAAGRRSLLSRSPGSVDRNRTLGIKAFEGIELKLPSYDDQVAISDKLERKWGSIRRARELLDEQERLLENLRFAFVDEAFSSQ